MGSPEPSIDYKELVETLVDITLIADSSGKFSWVSPQVIEILGYQQSEIIGVDALEFIHEDDRPKALRGLQEVMDRGSYSLEYRVRHKNGHYIHFHGTGRIVFKDDDVYLIAQIKDITDRKQMEKDLTDRNIFIQTILDNLPIGVATNKFDSGTADYMNRRFQEIYGWPVEEMRDISEFFKKVYPDDEFRENLQKRVMEDINSGDKSRMHWENLTATGKDGSKRMINAQNIPLIDQNTMVSTVWDVTEERKAEEEKEFHLERLKKRTKELGALLKGAEHVLEGGKFNDIARAIFDIAREMTGAMSGYVALLSDDGAENEVLFLEAGGMPCDVNPELPMPIRGLRAESYRTGKAVYENDFMNSEWVKFMPKGHVVMRNVLFSPLNIKGKTVGIIGLANKEGNFDEEDKRMAEAFGQLAAIALKNSRSMDALIESEERYRSIFNTAANLITSVNSEGIIIDCNNRIKDILGYEKEEIIGQPMSKIIHPDHLSKAEESLREILEKGISLDKRYKMIRKDGSLIDITINSSGLKGTNGKYFRTICIIEDITQIEQNRIELDNERKRAELYLDLLSHDIGNLHQGIASFAQIARASCKPECNSLPHIITIEEIAKRSQNLINNVKVLSSIKDKEKDLNPLNIIKVLDDSIDVTRKMFTKDEINIDFDHPDERILVDSEPVIQNIFVNLIHNGIKAQIGSEVKIEVQVKNNREEVIVTITDHGPGIPEKMKDGLFRRKENSIMKEHTGIGLSLVRILVDRYSGTIVVKDRVEGDHSQGACFEIKFPLTAKK